VTSHEPENSQSAEHDNPDTEVISIASAAPVFVDSTGRRSRLLRRVAYAFGALVILYGGLISLSLAGGPVRSSAVLPLPGLEPAVNDDKGPPLPSRMPAPSHSSTALFVADSLPRRTTALTHTPTPRLESTKAPSKSATAKASRSTTPAPSATTTKPVESTTTKPTTKPTTTPTTPGTSVPKSPTPVAPEPPATGTGGGE
jgi:hypothetical protein